MACNAIDTRVFLICSFWELDNRGLCLFSVLVFNHKTFIFTTLITKFRFLWGWGGKLGHLGPQTFFCLVIKKLQSLTGFCVYTGDILLRTILAGKQLVQILVSVNNVLANIYTSCTRRRLKCSFFRCVCIFSPFTLISVHFLLQVVGSVFLFCFFFVCVVVVFCFFVCFVSFCFVELLATVFILTGKCAVKPERSARRAGEQLGCVLLNIHTKGFKTEHLTTNNKPVLLFYG